MKLPSDQDISGRTLGDEEIANLAQAVRSGVLTGTKGTFVKALEKRFAEELGVAHAFACSSGTAAIHCAVAAIDPEPGEEIITSPITDMGALTPILYQGAIPVFADVDPRTCNVTADSIANRIGEKTRGIVVTHLFGNPCEMEAIASLAREKDIPLIEDCAQAYRATCRGRGVGTIGEIGCFSLQQGKQITTGEGGLVVTDNEDFARRIYLFVNKAWGYGDPSPDHYFLALNYRMPELVGAVALAQLAKLEPTIKRRIERADRLTDRIEAVPGIAAPWVYPGNVHTYWRYALRVDGEIVRDGSPGLGAILKERGISAAPRYVQKPAFQCEVFREQRTFGESRFPFTLARPEAIDYSPERFPGTFKGLEEVLVLGWNERYTEDHVDYIGDSIIEGVARLSS